MEGETIEDVARSSMNVRLLLNPAAALHANFGPGHYPGSAQAKRERQTIIRLPPYPPNAEACRAAPVISPKSGIQGLVLSYDPPLQICPIKGFREAGVGRTKLRS